MVRQVGLGGVTAVVSSVVIAVAHATQSPGSAWRGPVVEVIPPQTREDESDSRASRSMSARPEAG